MEVVNDWGWGRERVTSMSVIRSTFSVSISLTNDTVSARQQNRQDDMTANVSCSTRNEDAWELLRL